MFNLEQSIADWRKQMLAAGIKMPVPLEELEIHLREEIERQARSGTNAEQAFENSIHIIGNAKALKSEFRKIHIATKSNRVLALLWFAGCLWSLNTMTHRVAAHQLSQDRQLFFTNLLVLAIYCIGVLGSVLLFCGSKFGVIILRAFALLFLIACIVQFLVNFSAPFKLEIWWIACAMFCAVSIRQLHLPKNLNPAA